MDAQECRKNTDRDMAASEHCAMLTRALAEEVVRSGRLREENRRLRDAIAELVLARIEEEDGR